MSEHHHDCLVLGAGPAGLSASLWLSRLGVEHVVLERASRIGGELPGVNLPVTDYLGLPATNGRDFLNAVERQLGARPPTVRFGVAIGRIDPGARTVVADKELWRARSLILALGLTRRALDAPGITENLGRGVTYSPTTDLERIAGEPVAVVGGGDGACENALLLTERCPKVWLVHRRASLAARPAFAERARAHPRIEVFDESKVVQVTGDGEKLTGIRIETARGQRELDARWLAVKIGYAPNTALLVPGSLELDEGGYVVTDRWLRSSCPGVFAAGDLCNPRSPCIAAAAGDGAVAAREVQRFLREAGPTP